MPKFRYFTGLLALLLLVLSIIAILGAIFIANTPCYYRSIAKHSYSDASLCDSARGSQSSNYFSSQLNMAQATQSSNMARSTTGSSAGATSHAGAGALSHVQ
jgi:hypothetical protein